MEHFSFKFECQVLGETRHSRLRLVASLGAGAPEELAAGGTAGADALDASGLVGEAGSQVVGAQLKQVAMDCTDEGTALFNPKIVTLELQGKGSPFATAWEPVAVYPLDLALPATECDRADLAAGPLPAHSKGGAEQALLAPFQLVSADDGITVGATLMCKLTVETHRSTRSAWRAVTTTVVDTLHLPRRRLSHQVSATLSDTVSSVGNASRSNSQTGGFSAPGPQTDCVNLAEDGAASGGKGALLASVLPHASPLAAASASSLRTTALTAETTASLGWLKGERDEAHALALVPLAPPPRYSLRSGVLSVPLVVSLCSVVLPVWGAGLAALAVTAPPAALLAIPLVATYCAAAASARLLRRVARAVFSRP